MKRLLAVLLLVVPTAAACAASPPPAAATAEASASCAALAKAAAARVRSVVEAHLACTSDADCVTIGQGASCADQCTTSMAREGDAAHRAIEADVDARECRQFREQGCRVEVAAVHGATGAGVQGGEVRVRGSVADGQVFGSGSRFPPGGFDSSGARWTPSSARAPRRYS